MSPEAATVALVLIGSWALIAALSGGTELWQAWLNYRDLQHWSRDGALSAPVPEWLGVIVFLLWIYAVPAVLVGAVLGSVYLALGRRSWWRALAFGLTSLGGPIASFGVGLVGVVDTSMGTPDSNGLGGVGWSLLETALPIAVMVVSWLLVRSDLRAACRLRRPVDVGATAD